MEEKERGNKRRDEGRFTTSDFVQINRQEVKS